MLVCIADLASFCHMSYCGECMADTKKSEQVFEISLRNILIGGLFFEEL